MRESKERRAYRQKQALKTARDRRGRHNRKDERRSRLRQTLPRFIGGKPGESRVGRVHRYVTSLQRDADGKQLRPGTYGYTNGRTQPPRWLRRRRRRAADRRAALSRRANR
jgi:hypothetical protein